MSPRPRITQVDLLGIPYRVQYVETVSREDALDGLICPDDRTIRIYQGLLEDEATEVLIHEVIHGLLMRLGRMEEADDECLVQGLAIGLHQAIKSVSACVPCDLPGSSPPCSFEA